MPYNQSAFRFRSDDSQSLNADAGWEAAINTNVTMEPGKAFRLRLELEETAGAGSSQAFTLQYRYNLGTWTDVPNDFGAVGTWKRLRVSDENGTVTDGAATTDVLSGSSESFVAGNGNVTDSTTAAVTINNAHSEFEFTLYVAPWENGDGDFFDFRLVLSGGTELSSYDQTPRLTLDNDTGQVGGVMAETIASTGPWIDGNGNLYMLQESQETPSPQIMMFKSTNAGLTWERNDDRSSSWTDLEGVDGHNDGNSVHIAYISSKVEYWRFDMSSHPTNPDQWGVENEDVVGSVSSAEDVLGIVARSDGTVVCGYAADPVGGFERVAYRIRSAGGTWGSEILIDTEASTDFTDIKLVLGANDTTHIAYHDNTNLYVYHRSLSAAPDNTLSGRERVDDTGTYSGSGNNCPLLKPVYWDDDGDEKVMVGWLDAAQKLSTSIITNDGTPAAEQLATDNTVLKHTADSQQPEAGLTNLADTAYIVYCDATTNDLYYTESTNGASWASDVELLDGITSVHIGCSAYTHNPSNGGDTVLAYIWSESTTGSLDGRVIYGEYSLSISSSMLAVFASLI